MTFEFGEMVMEQDVGRSDDAYTGAFLREFAKHLGGLDLTNALDCCDAFMDAADRDPVEDARSEADEWRRAS